MNSFDRDPERFLAEIFKYQQLDADQEVKLGQLRATALAFAKAVMIFCPPSEDQRAALRKVREALMTATASIALKGLV